MKNKFQEKKVLFIGAKFHSYEEEIIKCLQNKGAEVYFYNHRPTSFVFSFIENLSKKLPHLKVFYHLFLKKLYKRISVNKKYDLFILIRGQFITEQFISNVKKELMRSDGTTVYYTWDSFCDTGNGRYIFRLFDRAFTFDRRDYELYREEGLGFLPLFCIDTYVDCNKDNEKKYDICVVAACKMDRYSIVEKIEAVYEETFIYLYIKPIGYILNYIFKKKYRKLNRKLLRFRPLNHALICNIYSQSKAVLDIPSTFQSGLTIRTLECLGSHSKLITTNTDVKEYDFYNEKNIYVLDEEEMVLPNSEWLNNSYEEIDKKIIDKYKVGNWIKELTGME